VMLKKDVIADIAKRSLFRQVDAQLFYDCLVETIYEGLAAGQEVKLRNLGSFMPVLKGEHSAVKPTTGEAIVIPPRRHVKFYISEKLRDSLL
jgi:nucleoid DNA-binding protein